MLIQIKAEISGDWLVVLKIIKDGNTSKQMQIVNWK